MTSKYSFVNVLRFLALTFAIAFFVTPAFAAPSAFAQFGTTLTDTGYKTATDFDGNIYVAGDANGTWGKLSVAQDGFLRKMSPTGTLLWSIPIATSAYDEIRGLAVAKDGTAYVCGTTNGSFVPTFGGSDMFLAKVSSAGVIQWVDQSGTTLEDSAQSVALDESGNPYVCGWTQGSMDGVRVPVKGYRDAFIMKYSPDGARTWIHQFNNNYGDNFAYDVAYYNSQIFITGMNRLPGLCVAPKPGNVLLYVYDLDGNKVWSLSMGGENTCGKAIAVNASGIYITGYTISSFDGNPFVGAGTSYRNGFAVKFDLTGVKQWSRQWGSGYWDEGTGAVLDTSNNLYISGNTRGNLNGQTSLGGFDAVIIKYSSEGTLQSTKMTGTNGLDYGNGICLDYSDNIIITGLTQGILSGQKSSGGIDAYATVYPSETTAAAATVTVKDLSTSAPLTNVFATVSDTDGNLVQTATTGSDGKFKFRMKAGRINIYKNRQGYVALATPEVLNIVPGTNSITSLMKKANLAPNTVVIGSPVNGNYAQGVAIPFCGLAFDPEDGILHGASLVWTSNINGNIGTGALFSSASLSVGVHTITLTATDSGGASAYVTRTITVYALTGNTATITVINKNNNTPISGVLVTIEDKDGSLIQEAITDSAGIVVVNMDKAGKIWIYKDKIGFTSVLDPDVQVINKGSKNNIVSYMK